MNEFRDTSVGTIVNGVVTAWNSANGGTQIVGAGGTNGVPTNLQTAGANPLEPNFTWNYPANSSDITYQFYLYQTNGTCPSSNCNIWQIPNQNSNSYGFTVAQDDTTGGTATTGEIEWNQDPTGESNPPNGGSLSSADGYGWFIEARDSNGNVASSSASDNNP